MQTEKWFIYDPEERRFRPIDFSELPQNSGYAFLEQEDDVHFIYGGQRTITLFSPSGEKFPSYSSELNDKKAIKECNKELQNIVNLAHKLSTEKQNA